MKKKKDKRLLFTKKRTAFVLTCVKKKQLSFSLQSGKKKQQQGSASHATKKTALKGTPTPAPEGRIRKASERRPQEPPRPQERQAPEPHCNNPPEMEQFEQDIPTAVHYFVRQSGGVEYASMRLCPDEARPFLQKVFETVSNNMCSDERTQRVKERLEISPTVCASCGVSILGNPQRVHLDEEILGMFRITSETILRPGCVVPGKEVMTRRGDILLLYPEGMTPNSELTVCAKCCMGFLEQKRPSATQVFYVERNMCFGRLSDLPVLSFVEEMCIARIRLFATVVQIVPQHGTNLKGTCIAFDQMSTETLAKALPPPSDAVMDRIKVLFVGTAEEWKRRRIDLLAKYYPVLYDMFSVDGGKVGTWLRFLKLHNLHYRDVDINLEGIENVYQFLAQDLFSEAHVCEKESTIALQTSAVSDIASVRPQLGAKSNQAFGVHLEHVMVASRQLPGVKDNAVLNALQDLCLSTEETHLLRTEETTKPDNLRDEDTEPDDNRTSGSDSTSTDEDDDVMRTAPPPSFEKPPNTIPRSKNPVNEFTDGARFFACAFPHLFPLGIGPFDTKGTLSTEDTAYLMRFHDGRFSRSPNFLFYCHTLFQRHAAVSQVRKIALHGSDEVRCRFLARLNSKEFKEKLLVAIENPKGEHAGQILKEILPYIRSGSCTVPNGPRHQDVTLSEMYSLMNYYGLPGLFVTVAPNDFNLLPVMKLAMIADGHPPAELHIPLYTKDRRIEICEKNPALCAAVFHHLLQVVMEELYSIVLSHTQKTCNKTRPCRAGIFGTIKTHYTVTEPQGRGTLHWHQLLWVNTCAAVLGAALRGEDTKKTVCALIENLITTGLPREFVQEVHVPLKRGFRLAWEAHEDHLDDECWPQSHPVPLPETQRVSCKLRIHRSVAQYNSHDPKHRPSCAKGSSGKLGCRYIVQKPIWDVTRPISIRFSPNGDILFSELERPLETPYDPFCEPRETVVWEQAREPHCVYISPYHPDLVNVCCSNVNSQGLFAPAQARSAAFYNANYLKKDAYVISSSLACLLEALDHVQNYESVAEDAGTLRRQFCQTLQRLINNMTARHEVSSQQAAATCLGYDTHFSSDRFWFSFPQTARSFLKEIHPDCFKETTCPADLSFIGGENPLQDDLDSESNSTASDETEEGGEVVEAVYRAAEGVVRATGEHINYFHSPPSIKNNVSLYEFAGIFDIQKAQQEVLPTEKERKSGRNKSLRVNFLDTHPQSTSKFLRLRSKQFVPNICGRISYHPGPIPFEATRRNTWWKKLQRWARYCIVTFIPWAHDIEQRLSDPVRYMYKWVHTIEAAKRSLGAEMMKHRNWCIELGRFQFVLNTTVTMRPD